MLPNLDKKPSLNRQVVSLALGSGAAQLLVAALYIWTARREGPEEYGSIVTAIALGVAGSGFIDLGASAYWTRELASGRVAHRDLNSRMSTRLMIVAALAVCVTAGASFAAPVFCATGALLLTTIAAQTALVPIRAARRADVVGRLVLIGRISAAVFYFAQSSVGVSSGIALWIALALGDTVLVASAVVSTPPADRLRFCLRPMGNPWSGNKWYAVSTLGASAQQLDLPIVAALSGPIAAGIYGGVNRWTQPLLIGIVAFGSAAAPFIAAEARVAVLRPQLIRASWILAVAVAICIGVFAAAPWLVTELLGDEFSGSAPVLRLLALAMLFNAITQPLVIALQARQFDHLAAGIISVAVVVHLTAVIGFAPSRGAMAAGFGLLVGQVVGFIGALICIVAVWRRWGRFAR